MFLYTIFFIWSASTAFFGRLRHLGLKKRVGDVRMGADSESFLVTVPLDWDLREHAEGKRKFPSVQDFIRELIRRDIEALDKDKAAIEAAKTNGK